MDKEDQRETDTLFNKSDGKIVLTKPHQPVPCSDDDSGSAAGHHNHGASLAERLIVEVDADDGIGTHGLGAGGHLLQGCFLGLDEHFLIAAAASAEEVAQAGHEIFKYIGADDDFTGHDAAVVLDGAAFDSWGCCNQHLSVPFFLIMGCYFVTFVLFDAKVMKRLQKDKRKAVFFVFLQYENRIGS